MRREDAHRATSAEVVNELGPRQKGVRGDDLHAVATAERGREQTELTDEQRLTSILAQDPGAYTPDIIT